MLDKKKARKTKTPMFGIDITAKDNDNKPLPAHGKATDAPKQSKEDEEKKKKLETRFFGD